MATFGRTNEDASSFALVDGRKYVIKYNLPVQGSVSRMDAFVENDEGSDITAFRLVIYGPDLVDTPLALALVAVTPDITIPSAQTEPAWTGAALAAPVQLQPGDYWIGFHSGVNTANPVIRGTALGGANILKGTSAGDAFTGGASNPWAEVVDVNVDRALDIYATYTPIAGHPLKLSRRYRHRKAQYLR